jgi:PAS domain-containing protein
MMDTLRVAGDVLGLVTFAAAVAVIASAPASREGRLLPSVKWLLVATASVYVTVTLSDTLSQFGITSVGEVVEDYIESLFPLLAVGVAFAAFAGKQYSDVVRAHRALSQSGDLMGDIVDSVPSGILFLDGSGRITFANDAARHALDLVDTAGGQGITCPGWVAGADGAAPCTLATLVHAEPYDGLPVTVRWPSGWKLELRVTGRPLQDSRGRFGGVVASFESSGVLPGPE